MNSEKIKITLGYIIICLMWGSTWLVIRVGLESLTPFFSAGLRFSLAALILFIIIRMKGLQIQKDKTAWILYAIMGFFSFVIPFGLVYWSEGYIPSSLASILFASYPFFVALFTKIAISEEKLTADKVLGIILGFFGIIIIFSNDLDLGFSYNLMGMIAVLISAMLQGIISVTIKKYGKYLNPLTMNFIPLTIAGIALLIIGLLVEDMSYQVFDWKAVFSVSYLAIFGTIVTFTTYYWLLQRMNIIILSLNTFITPIIAIILGYILLNEVLSINDLIGTFLVLMGILFANFKGLKKFYSVRFERSL